MPTPSLPQPEFADPEFTLTSPGAPERDQFPDTAFFEPTPPAQQNQGLTPASVTTFTAGFVLALALVFALPTAPPPPQQVADASSPAAPPERLVAAVLLGEVDATRSRDVLQYLAFVHPDSPVGEWARHRLRPVGEVPSIAPQPAAALATMEPAEDAQPPQPMAEPSEGATPERRPEAPAAAPQERPAQPAEAAKPKPVAKSQAKPKPKPKPKPDLAPAAHEPPPDDVRVDELYSGIEAAFGKLPQSSDAPPEVPAKPAPEPEEPSQGSAEVVIQSPDLWDFAGDENAANRAVQSRQAQMNNCLKGTTAEGDLELAWTVEKGKVQNVQMLGSSVGNAPVEACLSAQAAKWRFEPTNSGEASVVLSVVPPA